MATAVKENNSGQLEAIARNLAEDFVCRILKERRVYHRYQDTVLLYGHKPETLEVIRDVMRRRLTEEKVTDVHVSIGEVAPSKYIYPIDVSFFYRAE